MGNLHMYPFAFQILKFQTTATIFIFHFVFLNMCC